MLRECAPKHVMLIGCKTTANSLVVFVNSFIIIIFIVFSLLLFYYHSWGGLKKEKNVLLLVAIFCKACILDLFITLWMVFIDGQHIVYY